jgi:hypothetical protein
MANGSRKRRRPSIPPIAAAWTLTAVTTWSCAIAPRPPVPAPVPDAIGLEYLGAIAYPPGTLRVPADDGRFGGLSGLAADTVSGLWVGAVDDPNRPRLAWFDVVPRPGGLDVAPREFTYLRSTDGVISAAEVAALDLESLVALPDGGFAATNEGYVDRRGVAHQPAVLRLARDGAVVGVAHPRERFFIDTAQPARGVRHNLGLESLARTPDGRLISGLEQPLVQDGPASSATRGGRVRLVEFVPDGATWRPGREWAYDLDATPGQIGYGQACQDGETGLSDLHALDDVRLVAVERACLRGAVGAPAFNPVRLYLVDLTGADDVSAVASLAGADVRTPRKRLLLDVTTLLPRMPPLLRTFSNFEGIAAGPPAPDGGPTLLLVSDDNFRDTQTLALLWLRLRR